MRKMFFKKNTACKSVVVKEYKHPWLQTPRSSVNYPFTTTIVSVNNQHCNPTGGPHPACHLVGMFIIYTYTYIHELDISSRGPMAHTLRMPFQGRQVYLFELNNKLSE